MVTEEAGAQNYLSLEEMIGLARVAGKGDDHHFRVLQLPYNLGNVSGFYVAESKFWKQQSFRVRSSAQARHDRDDQRFHITRTTLA